MNLFVTFSLELVASEAECEIKKPLKDASTTEGETISLELEITKPRKVKWRKAGKDIMASDRFKIEVSGTCFCCV